jgi:hypothetical protein
VFHATIRSAQAALSDARAICALTQAVRDRSRAAQADTAVLIAQGRALCGRRALSGGSDASSDEPGLVVLITSVILERPTCLICLAEKVGASKLAVVRTLERMERTLLIKTANDDRCRACGSTLGPVYSLTRRD